MLTPQCETFPSPLQSLAFASLHQYPHFISRLSTHTNIDPAYTSRSDFLIPYLHGDDITAANLTGDQARVIEPALSDAVTAAMRVKGGAHVDNRRLVEALRAACTVLGADIRERRVQRLLFTPDGASVNGIVVEGEGFVCGAHYILAAGAWSTQLLPSLPVRPVKGQMLSLRPPRVDHGVNRLGHVLHGHHAYIVPKIDRGEYYIGATVEEGTLEPGNTAGGIAKLINRAVQLVPAFANYDIADMWSGLRPATPDLMPILGATEYTNLSVATGHYRNGILLAPASAKIVAATALGEVDRLPPELRKILPSFSMARFFSSDAPSNTAGSVALDGGRNVPAIKSPANAPDHVAHSAGRTDSAVNDAANASGHHVRIKERAESAINDSKFSSATPAQPHAALSGADASQTQQLVYRVLSNGKQEPVKPSDAFTAKVKASSRAQAGERGEKQPESEVLLSPSSTTSTKENLTSGAPTTPSPDPSTMSASNRVRKNVSNLKSITGEDDAYEDVMQHRGDKENEIMDQALAENRAFGRKESSLEKKRGIVLSLVDEEVDAFDKALARGEQDFEEFAETFNPNHPSVLASQIEKAALSKLQGKQGHGVNGAPVPIAGDGTSDVPHQSDGYF